MILAGAKCKNIAEPLVYARVGKDMYDRRGGWNYYKKYQEAVTGIPAVSLPSTSPANAAWTLEKLEGAWGVISDYLE